MSDDASGIVNRNVHEMPIAVIDFETTGLSPGFDRVVEASIVRVDPGGEPRLVFDTLINPRRPMGATEVHGITDVDVQDAPTFREVVGDFVRALSGCVVAAYNVSFEIRFLQTEMRETGLIGRPPHVCLMYLRPMLDLGDRCTLDAACRAMGVAHGAVHAAALDAQAAAGLLAVYLDTAKQRGVTTFGDLAHLKQYDFVESFELPPLTTAFVDHCPPCGQFKSRTDRLTGAAPAPGEDAAADQPPRNPVAAYWDALATVLADLKVTEAELAHLTRLKADLGLSDEQVRMMHARAFMSAISQFVGDGRIDDGERQALQQLHGCLATLGWAPGQG